MDDLDKLKIGITVGLLFGILFVCIICYFILNCIAKRYNKESEKNGKSRRNKLFTRLNLFSGGVFFATSFLHLLPEAKEEMRKFFDLATITFQFPACEFIVSIGFFLVLFAEQLTSRLHRIFVARKKTKSLQSNQTPIFTAEIPTNVTTEDRNDEKNKNKFEYKADYQNVESLAVENKTNTSECEDPDNQISSIVLCNDATCTEYKSSATETFYSVDAELPSKRARRGENIVDDSFDTTKRNESVPSNKTGIRLEAFRTISESKPSMLTVHSQGSSLNNFKLENNLTNYNPVFSTSKLAYCSCSLNQFHKCMNGDTNITNKISTTAGTESYLKKAIEPSDSVCTINPSKREGYRAIILLVSLLFHSLFDGLALGLQTNFSNVYTILIAVLFHKTLVAFSLTLKFFRAFPGRTRFILLCLSLFSAISPIGCLIGWLVSGSDSIHIVIRTGCSGILQSLAAGTFLYVTFIEILGPELGHGQPRLISISFVFLGFLTIAILKFVL